MKLNKDQVKKLSLSVMGFIFLLYVYFSFFLGPLSRSRDGMLQKMKDLQSKLDASKEQMSKAVKLEQQAKSSTSRFAALKALNPEGAPIAWFPPRVRAFFANQQVDKVVARLDGSVGFKQDELSGWMKYSWIIDLPQADYGTLGRTIAELENTNPLLSITKLSIKTSPDQPQFQHVDLAAVNIIQKQ
jgi:hypothetical protein